MAGPTFEWGPAKAAANLLQHGVSFEEAATVFRDPLAKIHDDPEHSAAERREIIVVRGLSQGTSDTTMRKPTSAVSEGSDELRPEYRFDYAKARPNVYAARLKGKAVAVVLDAEVAAAFPTSESVNTALRAVIVQRRSKRKPRVASRRSNNRLQRPAQAKKPRR